MLQDLDTDQIAAFVDRWHAETFDSEEQAAPKRERLKKAIKDSKVDRHAGRKSALLDDDGRS